MKAMLAKRARSGQRAGRRGEFCKGRGLTMWQKDGKSARKMGAGVLCARRGPSEGVGMLSSCAWCESGKNFRSGKTGAK